MCRSPWFQAKPVTLRISLFRQNDSLTAFQQFWRIFATTSEYMVKYMSRIYEDVIKEINSRLELVDIVSETVQLTRKGNRYWGLCPFHQEKTASFSVTPERNMFYCFGCHAGGDMISYIMKRENMEFREAVEYLANRAGVTVQQETPASGVKGTGLWEYWLLIRLLLSFITSYCSVLKVIKALNTCRSAIYLLTLWRSSLWICS